MMCSTVWCLLNVLHAMDCRRRALLTYAELVGDYKPDAFILDPFSSTHTFNENTSDIKQALNAVDILRYQFKSLAMLIHHASSKENRDQQGNAVRRRPLERCFEEHSSIVDWCDTALVLYDEKPAPDEEADEDVEIATTKDICLQFAKTRYTESRKPVKLQIDFTARLVRAR